MRTMPSGTMSAMTMSLERIIHFSKLLSILPGTLGCKDTHTQANMVARELYITFASVRVSFV
jgi:hypothetical protein